MPTINDITFNNSYNSTLNEDSNNLTIIGNIDKYHFRENFYYLHVRAYPQYGTLYLVDPNGNYNQLYQNQTLTIQDFYTSRLGYIPFQNASGSDTVLIEAYSYYDSTQNPKQLAYVFNDTYNITIQPSPDNTQATFSPLSVNENVLYPKIGTLYVKDPDVKDPNNEFYITTSISFSDSDPLVEYLNIYSFTYNGINSNGFYVYDVFIYLKSSPSSSYLDYEQTPSIFFGLKIGDGNGNDAVIPKTQITINNINEAPTGSDKTIIVFEDTPYSVKASDIGFVDPDGNALYSVTIKSFSPIGIFKLNGQAISTDQVIAAKDIGNLTFTPVANASGNNYANFKFTVSDGSLSSSIANTITFNVNTVNDAPTLVAPTAINLIDSVYDDSFTKVNGTLIASDVDSSTLTFGISGGIDNGNGIISFIGLYGTLTVNKSTAAYSYVANDSAIEALTAPISETFVVTVSDGVLIDSKTLSVNISQSGITESNANDSLTGTAGNDKFNSLGGNDIINGLAGADIMDGGSGNDVYYVDNIGDVVIENSSIATEIDRVISSISYTLSNNTENLVLSGKTAVNGTGNALKNSLLGNAAANILDGMAGNDILTGGNGNDVLIGGLGKDKLVGGNDADIFKFNAILESVNNTNRDTITDFLTIQGDKIDLSMIDADSSTAIDNAFSVLNVGAFNGSFVNTANLFFDSSSHILYGNNDSDEAADFSILLTGVSTLTISDILI